MLIVNSGDPDQMPHSGLGVHCFPTAVLAVPRLKLRRSIWGYFRDFFLFLHKNICCGYSLEATRQGASNKYPQHNVFTEN